MKTRQEEFEESRFWRLWKKLITKANAFDPNKLSAETKAGFIRSKKILKYADSYLTLIDWDLMTQDQFDELLDHDNTIAACHPLIDSNTEDKDEYEDNTREVNELLESTILPVLQTILTKAVLPTKRQLSSVYKDYNLVLSDLLTEVDTKELKERKEKIDEYYYELLVETEEYSSTQSKISAALDNIKKQRDEIQEYYTQLMEGVDDDEPLSKQLSNKQAEIDESIARIEEKITQSENLQSDFRKFHSDFFGIWNSETEQYEGGGIQRFKKEQEDWSKYSKEQKDIIENIKQKIESYMPNAVSTGLASGFQQEADKLAESSKQWPIYFAISLVLAVSMLLYLWQEQSGSSLDLITALKNISLVSPFIWAAVFFGKRYSETNRLYHEYLHKKTISNSFSGYEKQIKKLNETDSKLLHDLLNNTIKSISKNPSETLGKKHSANQPVTEIIEKTINTIKQKKDNP